MSVINYTMHILILKQYIQIYASLNLKNVLPPIFLLTSCVFIQDKTSEGRAHRFQELKMATEM
jgi:hypothetical protein